MLVLQSNQLAVHSRTGFDVPLTQFRQRQLLVVRGMTAVINNDVKSRTFSYDFQ
jgi:hypothetical protein